MRILKRPLGAIFVLIIIHFIVFPTYSFASPTSFQKDLKELEDKINYLEEKVKEEQEKGIYREDLYQVLLQNEKDFSGSLYNFATILVIVITLFVTVAGIILTFLLNKLKKHQEKINLVLDSKEFDEKVTAIEIRLREMRLRERNQIKSEIVNKFNRLRERSFDHIKTIDKVVSGERQTEKHIDSEKLLKEYEYDYLKQAVSDIVNSFNVIKEIELNYEDDEEEDVENPEVELESLYEDLDVIYKKLQKLEWHELFPI